MEIMKETYFLPVIHDDFSKEIHYKTDKELTSLVSEYINTRIQFIQKIWSHHTKPGDDYISNNPEELADSILKVLTNRLFNYQSKRSINQIVFKTRKNLIKQIKNGSNIHFYLLYNGGYRASPLNNELSLIFEPDQTELMLLYQISLLRNEISKMCSFDIDFSIVVNNGVAKWVNDIPITATENYSNKIRKMIKFFGAEKNIHILQQSELNGFEPNLTFKNLEDQTTITDNEHFIVERFLGRSCSREEAIYRSDIYKLAESKWAEDMAPIIESTHGIVMRQVAHPDMLSFRPFPGGAIRIQNGSFGFHYLKNKLRPKLITSKLIDTCNIKWIDYHFSLDLNKPNYSKSQ
jgi:hypothetical protein